MAGIKDFTKLFEPVGQVVESVQAQAADTKESLDTAKTAVVEYAGLTIVFQAVTAISAAILAYSVLRRK